MGDRRAGGGWGAREVWGGGEQKLKREAPVGESRWMAQLGGGLGGAGLGGGNQRRETGGSAESGGGNAMDGGGPGWGRGWALTKAGVGWGHGGCPATNSKPTLGTHSPGAGCAG